MPSSTADNINTSSPVSQNTPGMPLPELEGGFTWAWDEEEDHYFYNPFPSSPPIEYAVNISGSHSPSYSIISGSGPSTCNPAGLEVLDDNNGPSDHVLAISSATKCSGNTSNDEDNTNNGSSSSTTSCITTSTDRSNGQLVSIMEKRRRRRMICNRESARQSRRRKQRHLEKLRNQVNRLKIENRDWTNRLRFVLHHCHVARTDSHRLTVESDILYQRLTQIARFLQFDFPANPY